MNPRIKNGFISWIGSNKNSQAWTNPAECGLVKISASSASENSPMNAVINQMGECFVTEDQEDSWVMIEISPYFIIPSYYSLRSGDKFGDRLRNWEIQGSNDGENWVTLRTHSEDESITSNEYFGFSIERCKIECKFLRVKQMGKNSRGNFHLSIGGFEVFGMLFE